MSGKPVLLLRTQLAGSVRAEGTDKGADNARIPGEDSHSTRYMAWLFFILFLLSIFAVQKQGFK